MTNLRQLLALNMKENRRKLGLSQARLAEKACLSTQYVAMIELERKFPSPENLEQIASALEIDTPELFSMPPSVEGAVLKMSRQILLELERTVGESVNNAIRVAVSELVVNHLKDIDKREQLVK